MTSELLIILIAIITGFVVLGFFIKSWLNKQTPSHDLLDWLKSTSDRLEYQNKAFTDILQENSRSLNERLDNAARVIGAVQKNIGEMSEIGRSMKDLQAFLKSPKMRGNIGEQVLKELLGQTLPKQTFHLQYAFKSGAIVDAAIQSSTGMIPIDSKFPLENYRKIQEAQNENEQTEYRKLFQRDVKKHILDIAAKYILPSEGTTEFALMYIPSEAVYYEICNDPDLFDFAHHKGVMPVAPSTFYAFLRTILMSYEGQKIEARAKEILRVLKSLQKDYGEIDASLGVLGKHLTNAYNQMNNVRTGFTLLGQKLTIHHTLQDPSEEDIHQLEGK